MSEESTGLKTREEVPTELTWNLEAIFSTDEEWEEEFEALKEEYKKVEKFKGTLADSPENLLKLFQFEDEFDGRLEKLYVYAHMRSDQDTTNSKYQDQNARAASLATEAMSAFSFVTPEILGMSDEQIESFLTQNEELKTYEKTLRDIMKSRPHVLSEKEEVLLAKSQEVSTTAGKTFGMLDNADIELPKITNEEGEEVQLSSGRYREFLDSKDREVRKSAFLGMHNTYKSFKNTFAATLSGQVKGANFYADARNYDSARAASLDRNNIPEKVYDQLVDAVNDRLPSLHRFMDLKKKY